MGNAVNAIVCMNIVRSPFQTPVSSSRNFPSSRHKSTTSVYSLPPSYIHRKTLARLLRQPNFAWRNRAWRNFNDLTAEFIMINYTTSDTTIVISSLLNCTSVWQWFERTCVSKYKSMRVLICFFPCSYALSLWVILGIFRSLAFPKKIKKKLFSTTPISDKDSNRIFMNTKQGCFSIRHITST